MMMEMGMKISLCEWVYDKLDDLTDHLIDE